MKEEEIRKRDVFNKYLELSAQDVAVFFKDSSQYETINCPACESDNLEVSFQKNNFQYCTCQACDTLFVNPRPSLEQMNHFYSNSPSTNFWVNEFFKPVAEARREKMFLPRAEYIADFLKDKKGMKVGDIGAGFGIFLEELKKIRPDFELIAIEPSVEMIKICQEKGLKVIPNLIEEVKGFDNQFDVLVSFELFEHLHTPKFFVEKIHKLLKPEGYFIFTTLNGLGFDIQVLWERSKSVSPPHHLNFFNPWSVSKLFESQGFRVVEAATPGKLDWDIIESGFLKENVQPDRFWQTLSKYGSEDSKKTFQSWISEQNFSSHMRIIVQKM